MDQRKGKETESKTGTRQTFREENRNEAEKVRPNAVTLTRDAEKEAFGESETSSPVSRPGTYEEHAEVLRFLRGYRFASRVLAAEAIMTLDGITSETETALLRSEAAIARARMTAVRNFLNRVPDEELKILLIERYVVGFTLEQCADALHVSRSTVYRMHLKAILLAEKMYKG